MTTSRLILAGLAMTATLFITKRLAAGIYDARIAALEKELAGLKELILKVK